MAIDPKIIELQKQLQLAGQNHISQTGVMTDDPKDPTRMAIAAINKAQGFGKGIGEAALTSDTMNYLSQFKSNTTTGNKVQPDEVAKAWEANQPPTYSGLSGEDFTNALLNKATAGVNSQYDSQNLAIMQNLANILSNLDAEKASTQANNKKQLETIHNNEFATTETSKELMNMSGWNPNNSGLAIGELGKIKIGADKERADAAGALVQALNDIARRTTLAQTNASNERLALEKWKANSLMGAEADALLQGDSRNYSMYRDSMSDFYNNRDFDYQKSVDDRNYNYQVNRDKVLDEQWLKQFNSQEQQRLIDNAIANRQISVSEGNLALSRAAQAWSKDPKNPDNIYKEKQIANLGKESNEIDSSTTIGPLYNSMMSSADPKKWLQDNSKYMTKEELTTLYNMLMKKDNLDITDLLK